MKKLLLIVILCLSSGLALTARELKGKVTDTASEPIPGVAVLVPGGNAALTDTDGSFAVRLPDNAVRLTFSCLGYKTLTVDVAAGLNTLDVVLETDDMLLEETVVIGYGSAKKVNLTGAVSTVTDRDLSNRTSNTLTHMLQGSVPGLYVKTYSGNPADEASINIRGYASINNASGSALVLVDGIEGDLSKVNPADVESVSVIKDASSSAIYGARAAYGVILVTTKNGKSGRPVVKYNGSMGFSVPTTRTDYETRGYDSVYILDLFIRAQKGHNYSNYTSEDMEQLLARRNDVTENPDRPWILTEVRGGRLSYIYYCNTDWYHTMYTDFNPFAKHNVSVSGGDERVKYFFSAGYDHKEGTFQVRPEKYNKYNLRSKLEFDITPWLSLLNNMSFYHQDYDYPGNASVDYTFSYSSVHAMASLPAKNPDGTWVYKTIFSENNVTNGCHIELGDNTKTNRRAKYNFTNTIELSVHPIDGLDIRANYAYRLNQSANTSRWTNMEYSKYPGEILVDNQGRFMNRLEETRNYNVFDSANLWANYKKGISGHNFKTLLGANYETYYYKNVYAYGDNLSSPYVNDFKIILSGDGGEKTTGVDGGQGRYVLAGVFGRLNYDYEEKYLAEFSFREDGSSKFMSGHRWGFFPSISVGWKMSEEKFWDYMPEQWNLSKIRLSAGTLGNQNVGDWYSFVRSVNIYSQSYLFGGDGKVSAASLSNPASPDITWETTYHYNLGLDQSFFASRLNVSADFFIRDTKGMVVPGEILPAVYGRDAPERNAADLRSQGYELSGDWKDTFSLAGEPSTYGVHATLADDVAYITKYQNPARILGTYYEGMKLGEIWGYSTDGVFATDEEAAAYTEAVNCDAVSTALAGGWKAGDVKFLDLDKDGEISKGEITVDKPGDWGVIGNSRPRWQWGVTLTAQWRGFDFSVFLQGIGKMDLYPQNDNTSFWGPYNREATYIQKDFLDKCWSEEHPDTYYPRPRGGMAVQDGTYITVCNDHFLLNMAYARLKNLTVGYTLPRRLSERLGPDSVRLYFTGENLYYVSVLKKINPYIDPEQMISNGTLGFRYPWQKPFVWGLDITF